MSRWTKQLTTLSVKNLKAHTWLYTKLALAFAVLIFLLCLFSAYSLALNGMQNDVLAEHAAANQIVSAEPIVDGLPDGTESFVAKRYDAEIKLRPEETEDGFVTTWLPTTVTLSVQGLESCTKDVGTSQYNRIFAGGQLLTANGRAELMYLHGNDDILMGRLPEAANEVVVAQVLLDEFELPSEQTMGKTLSMTVQRGDDIIEISNIVVCGILLRQYSELSVSGEYFEQAFSPYLLLSQDNPIFADSERVADVYVYSLPYWLSENEIDELTELYKCVFIGNAWMDDMVRISLMQIITTKLFVVVGGALGCSVVLMIFLMMDKLIAVFSRDCGILLSCGMQYKQAKQLLLVMLAWVCLFAFVIAAILSSLGIWGINAAIYEYYYLQITVSPVTVLALFGIGIGAVTAVAFIYYVYALSKMRRRTIKEFLNTPIT